MSITEEQKEKIIKQLNEQYGDDWDGVFCPIKGQNRFYAVHAPESAAWIEFKTKTQDLITKSLTNKKANTSSHSIDLCLIVDCLITDIEGLGDFKQLKEDIEFKPVLVESLSGRISALANQGLEDLKKN